MSTVKSNQGEAIKEGRSAIRYLRPEPACSARHIPEEDDLRISEHVGAIGFHFQIAPHPLQLAASPLTADAKSLWSALYHSLTLTDTED